MLDTEIESMLDRNAIRDGRMLVAVSGGRDSMVLLDVLLELAPSRGLELRVAHVDHGLRGRESEADAALVREVADRAGVAFTARRVSPEEARSDVNSRSRPSLEEAARNLRRGALVGMAEEAGCRWIATAHHAGDQAETVLLRLLRGTGPDGLAAMAEISADGRFLKPMLHGMPEEVQACAERRKLTWCEDASNQDRRFARNRLRHDWIPALAETFNPQLLRSLVHLAEAERRDLEWIESLVREAAEERIEFESLGIRLAIDGWSETPEALARRLVRFVLVEAGLGRDLSRAHIVRMLAFLRRGRGVGRDKRLELPGGICLVREGDSFLLQTGPG